MGLGKISIQRQRMFTFGDAPRGALGVDVDNSQHHMAPRMVRDQGQDSGRLRFSREEGRRGIGYKHTRARGHVHPRRSNERVYIAGIDGERAIEKAPRLRKIVRVQTLVEPSHALKVEVHRVRGRPLFRPSRLSGDELGVQRACQPRDNFVLHVEEVDQSLIEPLRPQMIARLGVDELNVDA